ncbi:MAG TPA: hypothetical protein VFA68_20120 [Terriglobales bacterium]|nr:hypothetical protein [Terriglobales bacterium]
MKRSPRRKSSVIAESLNKGLNYYALAASAAGVTLLSLSQPANAEVIFTPANITTGAPGSTFNLDLNNDGIPDFTIKGYGDGVYNAFMAINVTGAGEAIQFVKTCVGTLGTYCSYAAALNQGDKIPGKLLNTDGVIIEVANANAYKGVWSNVQNHFLGLKFKISGQTHYAWVRMSVRAQPANLKAHISGYAYENTPNKAILAGQRTGAADASTPGSLGALARGAAK